MNFNKGMNIKNIEYWIKETMGLNK